jgi:hypothetical protein
MKYCEAELPQGWKVKQDIYSYEKESQTMFVLIQEQVFGRYIIQVYEKKMPKIVQYTKDTYLPKEAFDIAEYILNRYSENLEGIKNDIKLK